MIIFYVKVFSVNNSNHIFRRSGAAGSGTKEDRDEWQQRAEKFDGMVGEVILLFEKLCNCQNRELVYDIYTYLWDMASVLLTLNGFIQWLALGVCTPKLQSYVVGQQTWFSGKFLLKIAFKKVLCLCISFFTTYF